MKEIGRLAEFLGVDPSVADTVAEKTNFSVMRDFKTKTEFGELAELFSDSKPNANYFRKGDQRLKPLKVRNIQREERERERQTERQTETETDKEGE